MEAIIKKRFIIIFKDGSLTLENKLVSDHFFNTRIIDVERKLEFNSKNWKHIRIKDAIESKPLSSKNLD